ncbi:MAG: hypothetical protein H6707_18175 [Deltaproteobacteria bacterium]|nr:hypothetical protein [Deltaproteobacteria bacterium]
MNYRNCRSLALALASIALLLCSCQSLPRRNPTGEMFPTVRGNALDGRAWKLPGDLRGKPTLLLIGYKQDSQFDIDRWLLGIEQLGLKITAIELPTIAGMFPRMFSTRIDSGMRRGIPKALWGGVITIYGDAKTIQRFTGTENALNARVILLDGRGKVAFFYDEGFAIAPLRRLEQALDKERALSPSAK